MEVGSTVAQLRQLSSKFFPGVILRSMLDCTLSLLQQGGRAMLIREQALKQFAAAQELQADIRGWLADHWERWLTPRRAAVLETALLSPAFGFLLGSSVFLL
jgi:hypothetical protein